MADTLAILYVDDEALMRRALVRALKRQPVDIMTAASLKEALAVASTVRFDLLITDYQLTDSTGLEVAKEIRAIQSEIAIMMVSGFFDWAKREKELEAAGIEYFISKPWEIAQLENVIREVLKRRRQP